MSAISSGAALDVNALVNQLMTAEREPYSLRFNRAEAVAKAKISAFGTLSSGFDGLKRALDTLKASTTFGGRTAKSSDDEVVTATASSSVGTGSYSVEVESLASAHKLISAGLNKTAGLGAGELTITAGSKTFNVAIEAGKDTPAGIRDAINAAAKAAGAKVNATVLNADDGQRLVLTATQAGADKAIKVLNSSSPANSALNALVFDPTGTKALTEQTAASDTRVIIDGVLRSSSSNTISDFIPGLTLNLKKAAPGEVKTLTVTADNSAAKNAVQAMVTAYNTAVTALANATKYDAATNTPSTLTGDASARSAGNQLRSALGVGLANAASAGLTSNVLGLNTTTQGTLVFDAAKFDAALASDPAAVQEALAGENGLAAKLGSIVTAFTGKDGVFTSRTEQLNTQLKSVATQREQSERRLAGIEDRYRKQFTALDVMLAQSQSTSNFLAQQLAGLSQ